MLFVELSFGGQSLENLFLRNQDLLIAFFFYIFRLMDSLSPPAHDTIKTKTLSLISFYYFYIEIHLQLT